MFDFSCNEEANDLLDWFLPIAFNNKRHNEKIEGSTTDTQTWRVKERVMFVYILDYITSRSYTCKLKTCLNLLDHYLFRTEIIFLCFVMLMFVVCFSKYKYVL